MSKKRSIIVNIDRSLLPFDSSKLISGVGMEFCKYKCYTLLQHAKRLIINNLTTDNILSLTKYCQFSPKLRIYVIFRQLLRHSPITTAVF